jgi:hypothetical protein
LTFNISAIQTFRLQIEEPGDEIPTTKCVGTLRPSDLQTLRPSDLQTFRLFTSEPCNKFQCQLISVDWQVTFKIILIINSDLGVELFAIKTDI